LPRIVVPPPGPRSLRLSRALRRYEVLGAAPRPGILWREARGANVVDVDGNRYVDLTAGFGVAAVGHRHPQVVAAVAAQARLLVHGLADAQGHPLRLELARRLAALAPLPRPRVFFAVSGADAVEVALKTVLLATGRPRILAFDPAYHGLTLGALATTSRPAFRAVAAPHLHDRIVRLPYGCPESEILAVLAAGDVAAAIVEPIVGREGVRVPPAGWLGAVRRATAARGTLLVLDEIFTGFGRTGRLFAGPPELGASADLICCGKALAGGMPLAAVLGRAEVMAAWDDGGEARHTATFVAHPLACAAACATLEILRRDRLVARASRLGRGIGRRLDRWPERFPEVVSIRGRGLLWGIELASAEAARRFVTRALGEGVLLLAGGPEGRVVQLVPPLAITERQLAAALAALERSAGPVRKASQSARRVSP
jgi:4-aminobutyrate aminotransferase-like enzyme